MPPSYNASSLQSDMPLPSNYEPGIELNPFVNNSRISNGSSYNAHNSDQATNNSHNNGNTVIQQKSNISFANPENKIGPTIEHKPNHNIAIRQTTTNNKTGLINWSRMAWRSMTQDNSPEVISWQQRNRNRLPTTAAFFDSIANSKSQKVVNAFADEFAGRPVMFVKEELSLIQQGEQTKTAQFAVDTAKVLKDAKKFVIKDAKIFINGDTTQTEIFFETVEQFIAADFERLRAGQATVIGTAIAEDFRALANMTSEELAAHLGHETGDAFLIFLGGSGLQTAGRSLILRRDLMKQMAGKSEPHNIGIETLTPTHDVDYGRNKLNRFVNKIKSEGITNPIKYVEIDGNRYVVDGHHRLYAAKMLNLDFILAEQVELPYKGYDSFNDLFRP